MPAHNVVANLNKAESSGDTVVQDFGSEGIKADVIAEATAATGVTIDSVECKDGKVTASGDTTSGDNATMGHTATEGLILTGQGSTSDITMKNDADATVLTVATGQTAIARVGGDQTLAIVVADANYTVLAENSGKIHHVANVSADRTFTLPPAAAGLYYEFQATLIAADGNDWIIVTGSDTNFFLGGVLHFVSDTVDINLAVPNGTDDATIQVNLPSVGTCVKMYCDGTNWFLSGYVFSVPIPTFT